MNFLFLVFTFQVQFFNSISEEIQRRCVSFNSGGKWNIKKVSIDMCKYIISKLYIAFHGDSENFIMND